MKQELKDAILEEVSNRSRIIPSLEEYESGSLELALMLNSGEPDEDGDPDDPSLRDAIASIIASNPDNLDYDVRWTDGADDRKSYIEIIPLMNCPHSRNNDRQGEKTNAKHL